MPAKRDVVDMTGVKITKCPVRVANGARKQRMANRGDAPTLTHAIRTSGTIRGMSDRRALQAYASKGM
jgi:hypothetical protein